jgi:SAM-dependent methyltransferase
MTSLSLALPPPPGQPHVPVWTGTEFRLGPGSQRVLAYETGASGWSEELFRLHEDQVGGDHFIDIASRRHALEALDRFVPERQRTILEIGCSGGHFLRELAASRPEAEIIGADYTLGSLERLGHRLSGVPLLQFDLTRCPLPDRSIDAAVLLNVLEHIEADDLAVTQLARILRPGGVLIVEVPAGPGLYDAYDQHLMHFRRYAMGGLLALVRAAGFEVLERSHLGFCLYPPFWLTKQLSRLNPAREAAKIEERVKTSMSASRRTGGLGPLAMAFERRLRRSVYLPFGIRCLLVARKPP